MTDSNTNTSAITEQQTLGLLRLALIDKLGPATARKMISYLGGIERLWSVSKRDLTAVDGLGEAHYRLLHSTDTRALAEQVLQESQDAGVRVLNYLDSAYPHRLKNCMDAPVILYYKGEDKALNPERCVSIVGTRMATRYGEEFTDKFVTRLVGLGVTVYSGLAFGIDVFAHKCTLKQGGRTVGVVAHGLDRMSPTSHRQIADRMLQTGGLLSEHRLGVKVEKGHFPMRNRIVAGISDATIVVESDKRGGSLITAQMANDYNRDVFALPGRFDDQYSRGCNWLIQNNQAHILGDIEEFIRMMGWEEQAPKAATQQMPLFVEMDPQERTVFSILGREPKTVDVICSESRLSMSQVSSTLLALEFKGMVRTLPGKQYVALTA